ncbi:SDR family oxidoreductase, partial [Erwinia amylovora]|uniref:SDR family oxidoreductase n=1 Tax=Erwinia amylovora TaxID=552 RepID=UPI0020BF86C5
AVMLPGDISNEDYSKKMLADAHKALGGLDILALLAGKQVAVENIADLSSEQFRKKYETNVFAMHLITQDAIPLLPACASIITTSSIH